MTRSEDHSMTGWGEIRCKRDEPHLHRTRLVTVDLAAQHGYFDYPQVPPRLVPLCFQMVVWDWRLAPRGTAQREDAYCPAADAVSETIAVHHIWEPPETIALLDQFRKAQQTGDDWVFVDIGAHIGWYSRLAVEFGLHVHAFEADPETGRVLRSNLTGHSPSATVEVTRIGPGSSIELPDAPKIVKIDIEGAEPEALAALDRYFADGSIKALMIELSPCFGVDTDAIVRDLISGGGFAARFMPPKQVPPVEFAGVEGPGNSDWQQVADTVRGYEQVNVLFTRR